MKSKILALLEILVVYAVLQFIGIFRRSTGIVQWENQTLGWSYSGMMFFVGIPVLVIWLTRRNWAEYGLSLANWQTNLDLGIKAYLVRFVPISFLLLTLLSLKMDYRTFPGGVIVSVGEILGIVLMLIVMSRQKTAMVASAARHNIIIILLLLLFPVGLALVLKKLTLVILSTVVWQFIFSGFGEEFVWRGYVQSRLNLAFGRPMCLFGIQFGAGLIITSVLFGFLHAFNTYNSMTGFRSLSWGWAIFATFSGLFFGFMREKTGTLLAPGIAHGLPDAVGEALANVAGWPWR
jgi:membrane protease YdiL (CAAX protease family)